MKHLATIGAFTAAALLCGCAGKGAAELKPPLNAGPSPIADQAPALAELNSALDAELLRLGVDPLKAAAKAPGPGNAVFDLQATVLDPDYAGPLPPTGVELTWTERCIGDYDQNGEVNAADLAPLGQRFGRSLTYRSPGEAGGLEWWPLGNPEDDGASGGPPAPPDPDSGAANWRLARVDGDFNGTLGISDITPIAMHWKESLAGYRVYRRAAGETEYQLLPDPDDAAAALTIPRSAAFPGGATSADPHRPVRYHFSDPVTDFGPYEYYVVAYDTDSGAEGSHSASGTAQSNRQPVAAFTADPTSGVAPLDVLFDASASSDADGSIVRYEWDFNGDGVWDADLGNLSQAAHIYNAGGVYDATLRVTDNMGATVVAQSQVTISGPPVAQLTANPTEGGSPLYVIFDASGSADADGQIVSFEWDFDGDGTADFSGADAQLAHDYATGGAYHAAVRALDDDGLYSAPAEVVIRIDNPPIARLQLASDVNKYPGVVLFDASKSTDPGGAIVSYEWAPDSSEYVSNTGDDPHYQWSYPAPGYYYAIVRVTDNEGYSDIDTVTVNVHGPAQGELLVQPQAGSAPLTVLFTYLDNGHAILFYQWDWDGDGTYDFSARSASEQHTYTSGGDYEPQVVAWNYLGQPDFVTGSVSVNQLPAAQLSADPTVGYPPLTVDFDARGSSDPDGSIVTYWFNPTGNLTNGWLAPQSEPTLQYVYNFGGQYNALMRVYDNEGGWAEASVPITAYRPPLINLVADPESGRIPLDVDFTVTGSDPDGTIVSYEYDLNGDGVYEGGPSLNATASTTYASVDYIRPSVRVTDSQGLTRVDTVTIETYGWTMNEQFDLMWNANTDHSAIVAGGNPATAFTGYVDIEQGPGPTSYFLRADDAQGVTWPYPMPVDQNANLTWGQSVSATVNGVPLMAYAVELPGFGAVPDDYFVRFSAARDAAGSAWDPFMDLDHITGVQSVDIGALRMVNGMPAFSYLVYDGTNYEIRYVSAQNAAGTAWASPVSVLSNANIIRNVSLIDANGRPAISYVIYTAANSIRVNIVRASNAGGTAWGAPVTVYGPITTHLFASDLVAVQGNPALAIANYSPRTILFTRATAADGSAWGAAQTLYTGAAGHNTEWPVLQLIGGVPAVAFCELNTGFLAGLFRVYYCEAQDPAGSSWQAAQAIAPWSTPGFSHAPYGLVDLSGQAGLFIWDTGGFSKFLTE